MFKPKRRKPPKMGLREPSVLRCDSHIQWIRGNQCHLAGHPLHQCNGKVVAAHMRLGAHAAMADKPGDDKTVPLCDAAHLEEHSGARTFAQKYGLGDLQAVAAQYAAASPALKRLRAKQLMAGPRIPDDHPPSDIATRTGGGESPGPASPMKTE